jgi:hypothetical protein
MTDRLVLRVLMSLLALFIVEESAYASSPLALPVATAPSQAIATVSADSSMTLVRGEPRPPAIAGGESDIARGLALSANAGEFNAQMRNSLVVMAQGGFAAIWQDGTGLGPFAVRLQMTDSSGAPLLPAGGMVLESHASGTAMMSIAAHPTSGVFAAYLRHDEQETGYDVRVEWIDGEGDRRWSTAGVSAFGPFVPFRYFNTPRIVAAPDGGAFVCATRSFDVNDNAPVMCQRFDSTGAAMWTSTGVDAGGETGYKVLPAPLVQDDGDLLVVWQNLRTPFAGPPKPVLIEAQRFSPDGTPRWGTASRRVHVMRRREANYFLYPEFQAAADGDGGAVLAFDDTVGEIGSEPPSRDVLAMRIDGEAAPRWSQPRVVVATSSGEQLDAFLAHDDGGLTVGVASFRDDGVSIASTMYRLDGDGAPLWGDGVALGAATPGVATYDSHATLIGDAVSVVYVSSINGSYDLRLARISAEGERLTPMEGVAYFTGAREEFVCGYVHDERHDASVVLFDNWTGGTIELHEAWVAIDSPLFVDGFEGDTKR